MEYAIGIFNVWHIIFFIVIVAGFCAALKILDELDDADETNENRN